MIIGLSVEAEHRSIYMACYRTSKNPPEFNLHSVAFHLRSLNHLDIWCGTPPVFGTRDQLYKTSQGVVTGFEECQIDTDWWISMNGDFDVVTNDTIKHEHERPAPGALTYQDVGDSISLDRLSWPERLEWYNLSVH
jgi:hypothetical protein